MENVIKNVTWIVPKDMSTLEDKYSEVLANIVAEMLTEDELKYLINELER